MPSKNVETGGKIVRQDFLLRNFGRDLVHLLHDARIDEIVEADDLRLRHRKVGPLRDPLRIELHVVAVEAQQRAVAEQFALERADLRIDVPRPGRLRDPLQELQRLHLSVPRHPLQGVDRQRNRRHFEALHRIELRLTSPRADRDEQELLLVDGPVKSVALDTRQHEELQRRIVVGRHAAVDEQALGLRLDDTNLFGREVVGRRRARAQDLAHSVVPVADVQHLAGSRVAIRIVPELGTRVVGQHPRATRIETLGDDREPRLQIPELERAFAQNLEQHLAEAARVEARRKSRNAEPGLSEDLLRQPEVESLDLGRRHAERERRGDDRARGGAADQVEVVAQPEFAGIGRARGEKALDPLEKCDLDDPLRAAAIKRKNALWRECGIEMLGNGTRHENPQKISRLPGRVGPLYAGNASSRRVDYPTGSTSTPTVTECSLPPSKMPLMGLTSS